MQFEDYLVESKNQGTYAWKTGASGWKEGVKLPWPNAKAIATAVNSEKADISALSSLLISHYQGRHPKPGDEIEIQDASAHVNSSGETVEVEFTYNFFRDRHRVLKAKIMIQEDE